MVYEDETGLLDLPLPRLIGRHQIENAGVAIAGLRHAGPAAGAQDAAIEKGLRTRGMAGAAAAAAATARWSRMRPKGAEVWLDGGHNPHGAAAVSRAIADLEEQGRPAALSDLRHAGKTKDAVGFLSRLQGPGAACGDGGDPRRGRQPGRGRALRCGARAPAWTRRRRKIWKTPCCRSRPGRALHARETPPRILICGSLYLAGKVLAENG